MIPVPPGIMTRFQNALDRKPFATKYQSYYKKWLRFYWDFCHKYSYSVTNSESLRPFLEKLREKRQKDFQVSQATDAVRLFYKIMSESASPGAKLILPCTTAAQHQGPTTESMTASAESCNSCAGSDEAEKRGGPDFVSRKPERPRIPPQPVQTNRNNTHGSVKNRVDSVRSNFAAYPQSSGHHAKKTPPRNVSPSQAIPPANPKPSGHSASWRAVFEGLRDEIMVRHYSPKTLKNYSMWIGRFQSFVGSKPPESTTDDDYKAFLTFLAVKRKVSASTQNQAFNALLFFFRHVMKREPGEIKGSVRAKRRPYLPTVLSRREIDLILANLSHPYDLAVKLLYGCGLRLFECLGLRVCDIDIDGGMLAVHDGKGGACWGTAMSEPR